MWGPYRSRTDNNLPTCLRKVAEVGLARVQRFEMHSCGMEPLTACSKLDFANDRIRADLETGLTLLRKLWWKECKKCGTSMITLILNYVEDRRVCRGNVRRIGVLSR